MNSSGSSREYGAYTPHHQHRWLGAESRRSQLSLAAPEEGHKKAMLVRLEHVEGIVAKISSIVPADARGRAHDYDIRLSHTQLRDLSNLHREARVRCCV